MTGRRLLQFLAPILLIAATGCAPVEATRSEFAASDPYEPFNRVVLKGNLRVDKFVLRPVAKGYGTVTPETVQHVVTNGLSHLALASDFANYVLQGDVDGTLNTLGRFTLNTVLGAGGLLNPADEFGLPRQPNDFGLTLARYGVDEGPYLVLPVLGPSTARDFAGFVVDRAFQPTTYISAFTAMDALSPTATGLGFVDARYRRFETIDSILYETEDPYVTLRAAYLQRRRAQVAGDADPGETLPDIFEETAPATN